VRRLGQRGHAADPAGGVLEVHAGGVVVPLAASFSAVVAMAEGLLTGAAGGQEPSLFQLAKQIELDQQVEIARMKQLLTELDAD
jgi:hypothetical protein